jgi:hypothetical protein
MQQIKYIIALCAFSSSLYPFANHSFMTYRSQGFDIARNNSGYLKDYTTNTADVTIEYTHSFDGHAINNYFFGEQFLIFSGSRIPGRGACDILADYFGLPTDFRSSLTFSPTVQNVIVDLDLYWLLGCCDSNFDLRINLPFAHTKWSLNPCEHVIRPGTLDYPAGYMSRTLIPRAELKNKALDVLSGQQAFGDLISPLQHGRFSCGALTTNKIADIYVALGYNVPCTDLKAFHIDLNLTIPTGTIPNGEFLFAPQIGNGRHWGIGGSVNLQYDLVPADNDCCYQITAYFDATVQHLFKSTQKRSYDLKRNGPGSRYMLLEDMIGNLTMTEDFSPVPFADPVDNVYITRLLYVIDATTLDSKIKINAQADVDAKLAFTYQNFSFNIGYNAWVRSSEKLVSRDCFKHNFYGIKGDAQVYGFLIIGPSATIGLPINATQSTATVRKPQGAGNTVDNFVNNNADNAALLYNVGQPIAQTDTNSLVNTGITGIAQINGSNQSMVITDADINNCSGLSPKAFTNKIFGSIEYDFETCENEAYLLLGGEAEFAGEVGGMKTAISQWGVWLKGGISY